MSRSVFVLARQSLRSALRLKLVAALLVLLAMVVFLLPHTVKGDGTPEGALKMLLTWTLGAAVSVLGAASLWSGCHALAVEAEEGTMGLLSTSPTPGYKIFLGKWLGLNLLNAGMLTFVMVAVAVQIVQRGLPYRILRPYQITRVSEESMREHAAVILEMARDSGHLPGGETDAKLLEEIREKLQDAQLSIAPGQSQSWRFDLPGNALRPAEEARITLDFSTPMGSAGESRGVCRVLNDLGNEVAETKLDADAGQRVEIQVPVEKIASSTSLTLRLENTGDPDFMAFIVGAEENAVLLLPRGSVFGNFAAVWLVLFSVLVALTGLGLAAGALFSLPVAIFIASSLAVMALVSHADLSEWSSPADSDGRVSVTLRLERLSVSVLRQIAKFTEPVEDAAPLDRLGESLRVKPGEALRAAIATGLFLPFLACCVAAPALKFREFK